MSDLLDPPLLACLVLTGIHVYLGIHVVARKVIFVDLALAQIAALGTVVGVALGYEPGRDGLPLHLYSFALTAAGALIFSVTRMRFERVPHEAIIGIVYASAFALTLLILSRLPAGTAEIEHILQGDILYLSYRNIAALAALYGAVGIFHYVLRRPFLQMSVDPASISSPGRAVLLDFLFYLSFGLVVTSSVSIAGVFLVFAYLVIPSVAAMLVAEGLGARLTFGWAFGALISILGVKLSYSLRAPTSPLVVCFLSAGLVGLAVGRALLASDEPRRALLRLGIAAGGLATLVAGMLAFAKPREDPFEHALHLLEGGSAGEKIVGLQTVAGHRDRLTEWLPRALAMLEDRDDQVRIAAVRTLSPFPAAAGALRSRLKDGSPEVRQTAVSALRNSSDPEVPDALLEAARSEEDPDLKITMLDVALEFGNPEAVEELLRIAEDPEESAAFRRDALKHVQAHVDLDLGQIIHSTVGEWWTAHGEEIERALGRLRNPAISEEEKRKAYETVRGFFVESLGLENAGRIQRWWAENRKRLRWDAAIRKFRLP